MIVDFFILPPGKYQEQVAGMLQRFLHIPDEKMPKKLDATHKMNQTLVADKQKHHEKHK